MSYPDDREAYLKGYEDAMRAAGQPQAPESKEQRATTPPGDRGIGGAVQRGIGTAIGWVVLFPIVMGLLFGGVAWLLGGGFATWAVFWGGLALIFALFAGVVILGFRLFIALWPIVIGVGIVVLIGVKLLG